MSLFINTDQIKAYASRIAKNMSFNTLQPIVEYCEIQYIIPYIGQSFFDELDAAFAATPTQQQTDIIKQLQRALAHYVSYEAMKETSATISDAGVLENLPEKASLSRQWVFNSSLWNSLTKADLLFDKALKYLEDNENDYATWKASDEYSISRELFINKTSEFSEFVPIGDSRRAFLKIRPFIALVEEKVFVSALGQDMYDELKAQLKTETLTADNSKLLYNYIQRPLAHFAFVEALPNMTLDISGNGIKIVSSSDGNISSMVATDNQRMEIGTSNLNNGNTFLSKMKEFIEANAALYPTYQASTSYNNGQPNINIYDNTGKKSFFV
jgi:hypothetical protein